MSVLTDPRCTALEWDSAFFGLRIGRFEMQRPSAEDAARATMWARAQRLDCLYALIDATHVPSIRALEQEGFALADVRLTLERSTNHAPAVPRPCDIGEAAAGDRDVLMALARRSHAGTRFTDEPRFGPRAAELYAEWVRGALGEEDAITLVPRVAGHACGYLTLHGVSGADVRVGVLAVQEEQRGRGIGQALLAEALVRLAARGARRIAVVTHGRNAAAVRFYERCGFQSRSCQLWYHRWFTP
jgi:dTDP-4-amino-4,6-dideoxy-D-galactose acyltransferase